MRPHEQREHLLMLTVRHRERLACRVALTRSRLVRDDKIRTETSHLQMIEGTRVRQQDSRSLGSGSVWEAGRRNYFSASRVAMTMKRMVVRWRRTSAIPGPVS